MTEDRGLPDGKSTTIATIENHMEPSQTIAIQYLREENAFVTSGIRIHFDEREILIPAYLVIMDLNLMGAIVSTILEKISQAHDMDTAFFYARRFDVLDKTYGMEVYGDYIKLFEPVD
ncbi:MAG: hypothetical protein J7M32_07240 [Deltaproteobacteria bacterium]|nr:hypothetical protein [Deltaproteobacteria bacterium]OQX64943.1 MAG: hypothetical protein B5M55_05105 [Desulfococcus sp. 4484_242]